MRPVSIDLAEAMVRIDRLALPPWGNAFELVDVVAVRRDRPIRLTAMDLTGVGFSGAVFSFDKSDTVIYEQDAPDFFIEHVIFHELSHLICGHLDPPSRIPGECQMLNRGQYSAVEEVDAETMATAFAARRWLQRFSRQQTRNTARDRGCVTLVASLAPHVGG